MNKIMQEPGAGQTHMGLLDATITVFFLGILLHIPCIFPLQGLLEYIYGLLQEYVRRSIPGVHIPKSPGIEHLRISWIFGSPVLKHPEVVPVAIPGMLSLS